MNNVLFVSNPGPQCGVHQFGKATAMALAKSKRFNFIYLECTDLTGGAEYLDAIQRFKPVAVIYNWHPQTMRWLSEHLLDEVSKLFPYLKHAGIVHDSPPPFQQICAIIHCDPTFHARGRHFKVGRLLPPHALKGEPRDNIIGSFGFGAGHKGFSRLIEKVNSEFDTAIIRLHIPYALYGDKDGQQARKVVEDCLQRAKQGVVIQASHHFMEPYELLDWLAGNTINCFFYDRLEGRGVSSALDFAIAARRPIAISNSYMFRHVVDAAPTILIEQASLRQIIANGIRPLEPFYRMWTEENLIQDYERIVDSMFKMDGHNLIGNRVLTPLDRDRLKPVVEELTSLAPEVMSRKIPGAVFQNAFLFQQARNMAKKTDSIMIIGGYEDPIGPALQKLGYEVRITDPQLDGQNMETVWMESIKSGVQYDLIISCSVLEHVENDVEFIQQMYQVLKLGGVALLTTDYLEDWEEGNSKPAGDVRRLYTSERLRYLARHLPGGSLLDSPTWGNQAPYFELQSVKYGFCSLAFRRTTALGVSDELVTSQTFPCVIAVTAKTPRQIGSFDSNKKVIITRQHEIGALAFGPYLPLEPGNYRAVFKVRAEGSGEEAVGKVDVNAFSEVRPDNPVATADLKPDANEQRVAVDFQSAVGMTYEFRIWANGKGVLSAKEIVIERRS